MRTFCPHSTDQKRHPPDKGFQWGAANGVLAAGAGQNGGMASRSPAAAHPDSFGARVDAQVHKDDSGNVLRDITLTFQVRFPDGEAGDAARAILPRVVQTSHDKTCTVSRTIEAGTPVSVVIG